PLFRWMLDTLLSISEIHTVVINTDARALLTRHGLSDESRVLVRDRRAEICGDDVSMNLILADDLNSVDADFYLMTHTTNPFLSQHTIKQAISEFKDALGRGAADSLFTVNKHQARFYRGDGSPI